MFEHRQMTRRDLLRGAAGAAMVAPWVIPSRAFGANDRIVMGCIGMGGQGRGDMRSMMGFSQVQVVALCDVVEEHRNAAKSTVDEYYGNKDCATHTDFREITRRDDVDAVLIATPDHWHALISVDAMKHGKDVFCEKPESLTVRQGRLMVETARRYGRVFSGGSQRVWEDYNWYHRMVRGGAIGEAREAWVNVGGPSGPCDLPPEPTPPGVEWERWLGPAPWRPYHPTLIRGGFRPYSDYSGGGMTDWGCHGFGGALFALNLHRTGPVEITPPDGKDRQRLTFRFANGVRIYHGGSWGGMLSFRGTEGEISGQDQGAGIQPPAIHIPNYKGEGGLFGDFVHCVRTRELPFRDIEIAHRTASLCHLGNIAYWLNRPTRWDPEREEIIGDARAAEWLDRSMREPWGLV